MCGKKPQNSRSGGKTDTEKRLQTKPSNQQQSSGRKVPPTVPRQENAPSSLEKQTELRSRQSNTAGQHKPREVRGHLSNTDKLSNSSDHRPARLPLPVPETSELGPNVPDIKTHPPQIVCSIQERSGDITLFCRWNGKSKAVHYVKEAILRKYHPSLVHDFREGAIVADKEYDEVVKRGSRMPVRCHRRSMSEWDYELSYPGKNYQKEKERMAMLHRDRPRDPLRLEQLIKDYEAARPKGVPPEIKKQARMSNEGTSSSAAKRPRLENSKVIDLRMQPPAVPSTSHAGKPHHSSFASVVNGSVANNRQRATSRNHGVPGPQNSSSSSTFKRPVASGVGSSSSTSVRPVASRPLASGVGSSSSNYDRSMDYGKRFQATMMQNAGSEVQVLPSSKPSVRRKGASQNRPAETINNLPGPIPLPVPVESIKIEPLSEPLPQPLSECSWG